MLFGIGGEPFTKTKQLPFELYPRCTIQLAIKKQHNKMIVNQHTIHILTKRITSIMGGVVLIFFLIVIDRNRNCNCNGNAFIY